MKIFKNLSGIKIKDKFKLLCNNTYSWLLSMTFIKVTAIVVVNCFLLTAVYGQAAVMVADGARAATQFKQIFSDFELPYSYGKISSVNFKDSDKIVINIQDLHSHAGVQKNISNIIEMFDNKYGVKNVYVEGAYGNVSTKWLTSVKNEELKDTIIESLLNAGRLTGAEYYSAKSGKTEIIKGLESKNEYLDNLKRFGLIVTNQEILDIYFKEIDSSVKKLQNDYYNRQQKKIEQLSKDYVSGITTPKKYFSLMKKYADKLGVDINSYENLSLYINLMEKQRTLNYEKITNELQVLVLKLKEVLPYGAYKMLLEGTKNFQQMDKLYGYIIKLSRKYNLEIAQNFPNLEQFFEYIELTQRINPLELITEEQNFKDEINDRFAVNRAEEEVIFLSNFVNYYKAYLSGKVTADDLNYYKENIEKFKSLWVKYIDNRLVKALAEYEQTADKFYEINLHRNDYFISNMDASLEGSENLTSVEGATDLEKAMNSLSQAKELYFVVAGGFHTEAIAKLLSDKNVTNIVITPNVQGDTKLAEETYYKIAKEQSKINFQALANMVLSKELVENTPAFLKAISINIEDLPNKEFEDLKNAFEDSLSSKNIEIKRIDKNTISVISNGQIFNIKLNEDENNIADIAIIEQTEKSAKTGNALLSDQSIDDFAENLNSSLQESGIAARINTSVEELIETDPVYNDILENIDVYTFANEGVAGLSFFEKVKLYHNVGDENYLTSIYHAIKQSFSGLNVSGISLRRGKLNIKETEKINEEIENAKLSGTEANISRDRILRAYGVEGLYEEYKNKFGVDIYEIFKKYQEDSHGLTEGQYDVTQTNVQFALALYQLKGGNVAELEVGGGKSDADALVAVIQFLDGNFSLATSSSFKLREEMVGDIAKMINSDAFAAMKENVLGSKEAVEIKYIDATNINKIKYVIGKNDDGSLQYSKNEDTLEYATLLDGIKGGNAIIVAPIEVFGYFANELGSSEKVKEKYGKYINNNSVKLILAEVDKFFSENLNFGISQNNEQASAVITEIYEQTGFVDKVISLQINEDFRITKNGIELTKKGENLLKTDEEWAKLCEQFENYDIHPQLVIQALLNVLYGQPNYRIGVDFNYGYDSESGEYYVAYYNEEDEMQGKSLTKDAAVQSAFTYVLNNPEILKKINNESVKIYAKEFSDLFQKQIEGETFLEYRYRTNNNSLPKKIKYSVTNTVAQNNIYSLKNKLGIENLSGSSGTISKNMKSLGFNIAEFKSMRGAKDVNIGTFLYDTEKEQMEKIKNLGKKADDSNEIDAIFMFADSDAAKEKWKETLGNDRAYTYEELRDYERTNKAKYNEILKGTKTHIILVGRDSLRGVNFNEIKVNDNDVKKMFVQTDLYDEEIVKQMTGRAGRGSAFEFTVKIYSIERIQKKAKKLGLDIDVESLKNCRDKSANSQTKNEEVLVNKIDEENRGSLVREIISDDTNHLTRAVNNGGLSYFNRLYRRIFLKQDLSNRLDGIAEQMSVLNIEQSRNNQILGEATSAAQNAIDNPRVDVLNEILKNISVDRKTSYKYLLQNFGLENSKITSNVLNTLDKVIQTQDGEELKLNSKDRENLISIARSIDSISFEQDKGKVIQDAAYLLKEDYKYVILKLTETYSQNKKTNLNSLINAGKINVISVEERVSLQEALDAAKMKNRIAFFNELNKTRDNASVLFDSTGNIIFNTLGVDAQSEIISSCYDNPLQKGMDTMIAAFEILTDNEISSENKSIFKFNRSLQSIQRQLKIGNIIRWISSVAPFVVIGGILTAGYFIAPVLLSLTAPIVLGAFAMVVFAIYVKKYTDRINSAVNQQNNANIAKYGNATHLRNGLRDVVSSVINQNLNSIMTFGLAGGTLAVIAGVIMLALGSASIAVPLLALTLTITPVLLITVGFVALAVTVIAQGLFIIKNKDKLQEQPATIQEETQKNTSDTVSGVIASGIALSLGLLAFAGIINPVTAVIAVVALIGSFMYAQYAINTNQGKDSSINLKYFAFGILCTFGFAAVIVLPALIPVVASLLSFVGIANPIVSFLVIAAATSSFLFPFAIKNFAEFEEYKDGGFSRLLKDLLKNNKMTMFLAAPFISMAILFFTFSLSIPVTLVVAAGSFFVGYYFSRDSFLEKNEGRIRFLFSIVGILLGGLSFMRATSAADNSTVSSEIGQQDVVNTEQQQQQDLQTISVEEDLGKEKDLDEGKDEDKDKLKLENNLNNETLSNQTLSNQANEPSKNDKQDKKDSSEQEKTQEQKDRENLINNLKKKGYDVKEDSKDFYKLTLKKNGTELDFSVAKKRDVGEDAYVLDISSADNVDAIFKVYDSLKGTYNVSNKINEDGSLTVTSDGFKFNASPFDDKGNIRKTDEVVKETKTIIGTNNALKNYDTKYNNDGTFTIKSKDEKIEYDANVFDKNGKVRTEEEILKDVKTVMGRYDDIKDISGGKNFDIKFNKKTNEFSIERTSQKTGKKFSTKIDAFDTNYNKDSLRKIIDEGNKIVDNGHDVVFSTDKNGYAIFIIDGKESDPKYVFDKDGNWQLDENGNYKGGKNNGGGSGNSYGWGWSGGGNVVGGGVGGYIGGAIDSTLGFIKGVIKSLFPNSKQFVGMTDNNNQDTLFNFYNSSSSKFQEGKAKIGYSEMCDEINGAQRGTTDADEMLKGLLKERLGIDTGYDLENLSWERIVVKNDKGEIVDVKYIGRDGRKEVVSIHKNGNSSGFNVSYKCQYQDKDNKNEVVDMNVEYSLITDIQEQNEPLSVAVETDGNMVVIIDYVKDKIFIETKDDEGKQVVRTYNSQSINLTDFLHGGDSWTDAIDNFEDSKGNNIFAQINDMHTDVDDIGTISDDTSELLNLLETDVSVNGQPASSLIKFTTVEVGYTANDLDPEKNPEAYNKWADLVLERHPDWTKGDVKKFYEKYDGYVGECSDNVDVEFSLFSETYKLRGNDGKISPTDNSNEKGRWVSSNAVTSFELEKGKYVLNTFTTEKEFVGGEEEVERDIIREIVNGNVIEERDIEGDEETVTRVYAINRYGIGIDSIKFSVDGDKNTPISRTILAGTSEMKIPSSSGQYYNQETLMYSSFDIVADVTFDDIKDVKSFENLNYDSPTIQIEGTNGYVYTALVNSQSSVSFDEIKENIKDKKPIDEIINKFDFQMYAIYDTSSDAESSNKQMQGNIADEINLYTLRFDNKNNVVIEEDAYKNDTPLITRTMSSIDDNQIRYDNTLNYDMFNTDPFVSIYETINYFLGQILKGNFNFAQIYENMQYMAQEPSESLYRAEGSMSARVDPKGVLNSNAGGAFRNGEQEISSYGDGGEVEIAYNSREYNKDNIGGIIENAIEDLNIDVDGSNPFIKLKNLAADGRVEELEAILGEVEKETKGEVRVTKVNIGERKEGKYVVKEYYELPNSFSSLSEGQHLQIFDYRFFNGVQLDRRLKDQTVEWGNDLMFFVKDVQNSYKILSPALAVVALYVLIKNVNIKRKLAKKDKENKKTLDKVLADVKSGGISGSDIAKKEKVESKVIENKNSF
ncbi:hypothetical protein, partial [Candidatus Ruminimicrobium bovinum]|uniref:hypothetical protein n=1 Tax=Candidatus Ruminimicrobium bovinum TaxID=3242779 RepID=UPI0039B8E1F8